MHDIREPYAVEFNGECMGGMIEHGSILLALPGEEIWPLDLVSVVLDGYSGPWANFINSISEDGFTGLVKVFLGIYEASGEKVCLFGQLNPPTIAPIPMSAIAAMDKLDFCKACSGEDKNALALLKPFAGIGFSTQKEAA